MIRKRRIKTRRKKTSGSIRILGRVLAWCGLCALALLLAFDLTASGWILLRPLLSSAVSVPDAGSRTPDADHLDVGPYRSYVVMATAYSSTPDQTDETPCITANGYDVCAAYAASGTMDTVAANFLPIGARVRLPALFGTKEFVVRDRMNDRYDVGHLDIWMPDREQARHFGLRRTEILVERPDGL